MKSGKDIILEYCHEHIEINDPDEVADYLELFEILTKGKIPNGIACPMEYGFSSKYAKEGLCNKEDNSFSEKQKEDICIRCWKKFLAIKGKTK